MLTRLLEKFKPARSAPPPTAASVTDRSEVTEWRPGETILDRYKVEQVFGGAMGKVYIAQHLGWQIPVAIKVPKAEVLADAEGAKRIFTEADSWVRMGMHPNVATCFYVRTIAGVPHLFIEYVDGGDLSAWIKTGRCRDPRTALSMAIQFCHGMEFTHAKGIIHRDIKPQNILVTKNALVKITDFGIVQSLRHPDEATTKALPDDGGDEGTTIGFRGTPGYASPEQFRDTHRVDRRTDIFSFGICLWMMFCGHKPYANNRFPEPVEPVAQEGAPPLPAILVHLLKKAVAAEPDDRYQDFKSLRLDLNQAYIELYRVDCPFMEIDFTDLEAENYNNRAVSFLELGQTREAGQCLAHAMEINDSLPEALHNDFLLRWQAGKTPLANLHREVEAVRQRLPKVKLLETLAQGMKRALAAPGDPLPEYSLCLPKNSADVFRTSQLHLASRRNVLDLLAKGEYARCHEVLGRSWEAVGFRKDKVFLEVYEQLLRHGVKKAIKAVLRLTTLPAVGGHQVEWLSLLPGAGKILFRNQSAQVLIRSYGSDPKVKVLDAYRQVSALAVSPNRQLLALATPAGVHLLSLKSGTVEKTLALPQPVLTMTFSPDGALLLCGAGPGQVVTLELATGKSVTASAGKVGSARALFCFDKRQDFVTGHDDGSLCFWEKGARECLRQLEAHAMPVTILSATPSGTVFLSAAADRVVKVWHRQTGQCLKSIKPHDDAVNSVMVLPGNVHFVTASDDDLIKIWDLNSGLCLYTLDGRGDGIRSLAMGQQPHVFLAGRNDGAIIAWMVIYDLEFS